MKKILFFFIIIMLNQNIYTILKIAHRGASGYELENTISAFKKAIELKVDFIELDVWGCKSGEIIVMHDSKIDRTTFGHGHIIDLTLAELRSIKSKNGDPISTLEEVINFVDKRCKINIEIKDETITKKIAEIIQNSINQKNWKIEDFLVSSFNHYILKDLRNLMSDIKIGALFECVPLGYTNFVKDLNPEFIISYYENISRELIENAHKNRIKVLVYTVNNKEDVQKMKELNVDGIISNFPDII